MDIDDATQSPSLVHASYSSFLQELLDEASPDAAAVANETLQPPSQFHDAPEPATACTASDVAQGLGASTIGAAQTAADASPEEQLRQLQQQLQQQQQLLRQLQQQQQHAAQSQATALRHDATFLAGNTTSSHAARRSSSSQGKCITNDRSAARRANRARQKALEVELESRLQSIAALHSQLLAENGMLQRRATLLQAGVNMREQHLNTLIQSRQKARQQQQDRGQAQQQQQQQQRGQAGPASPCIPASDAVRMEPDSQGAQCERVGEASSTLGLPSHASSSQAANPGAPLIGGGSGPGAPASPSSLRESGGQEGAQQQQQQHRQQQQQQQQQQQPQLVGGAAQGEELCCTSFALFPDPGSWGAATCAMVRRMTPKDFQRCWTDFVKEASMLALASQSHPQDSDLQQRLTKVVSTCLAVTDHITAINPSSYYSSMYVNLVTGQPMNPDRDYWRDCMRRVPLQPEQLEFCKTAMEEHARKMATVLNERCKLASDLSTKLSLHPMEASDLSRKLQSNVHQEHVTNSFVADFLTIQVLTPAQIALLSAAAYPLMPDPMAMAEVAIELAESQAAQTLAP